MRALHSTFAAAAASFALLIGSVATAAPGDPIFETCPEASDIGTNVACYPVTITSKTLIHPNGIPLIGYLFVPTDAPDEPLPAIFFAHGSGSMYSSGNHNKGLNSKHIQWVREYTGERGIVTFHVSSFHSRYLLPDTPGDQRIFDIEMIPDGFVGGDDYRATSYMGSRDKDKRIDVAFDPDPADGDKWKDSDNGRAGVSEIIERSYDSDAAWDFLAGIRKGRFIMNSRNAPGADTPDEQTLGTPGVEIGFISEIVPGLTIDHERTFFSGTSHGGQNAMATAHAPRALADDSPMNVDLPAGFNRKRYAGFFDYYGGCGLYGAYGGDKFDPADPQNPEKNSTWRPYNPFLMLHGENDPIWKDESTDTTRGDWFAGECYRRIAAAKADPAFDVFLETVIYKDAYHSFDGISRDDFDGADDHGNDTDFGGVDDWIAKIHANERMTLGLVDAVGEIVSARRNGAATVPTLADFGFNEHNPYFSTFPLVPPLPPRVDYASTGSGIEGDGIIQTTSRTVFDDMSTFLNAVDPAGVHDLSCAVVNTPSEVTATGVGQGCKLTINLETIQIGDLHNTPYRFTLDIQTPLGTTYVPVEIYADADHGYLRYFQAYSTVPNTSEMLVDINASNFTADARSLVWSWQPALETRYETVLSVLLAGGTYSLTGTIVFGPVPDSAGITLDPDVSGHGSQDFGLMATFDPASAEQVRVTNVSRGPTLDIHSAAPLPALEFGTDYTALTPVDNSTPSPPGEFPDGTVPPASGGSSGDGSGGNNSGGDNSGSDGPGGDSSNGDDSGGGGGAFFWLLPFAWFARRR